MKSCIFEGRVRHTRVQPVSHAFNYRIFLMYLDLAELPALFDSYWLWSARQRAIARFRRENHLGPASMPLDTAVRNLVAERTGRQPSGPVRLLTHLSYFGYCFNPVCFYYCYNAADTAIDAIVVEVNNTPWGEQHCYVLEASDAMNPSNTLRFRSGKEMHVSPFMPMDIEYDWCFTPPGENLRVFMANSREGRRFFDVGLVLKRREISSASLARVLLFYPLMTLRVIGSIYWQALRLWLKGTPVFEHPLKRAARMTSR